MHLVVAVVFCAVYLCMMLGRIPGLAIDRTGAALVGAIVLVGFGAITEQEAWNSVHIPTIGLLFGLMIVSTQFRMSGFYSYTVRRLAVLNVSAPKLLAAIIVVVAALSSVLANDIVCLAMAPVIIEVCSKRSINPLPFLIALACSSNIGSALTLIGNPQNMLIAQSLNMPFLTYSLIALAPVLFSLFATWAVVCFIYRGRWNLSLCEIEVKAPVYNIWQTRKGFIILFFLVWIFLLRDWPRDIVALAGAGILLLSRKMRSRDILGIVDWQLIVLFISLFMINHAVQKFGFIDDLAVNLTGMGFDIRMPVNLYISSAFLSNIFSNVPAVMFLLPYSQSHFAGYILALSSTLAGNLIIVGSIANIIVVDQASRYGIKISWIEHAKAGIPITIISLLAASIPLLIL